VFWVGVAGGGGGGGAVYSERISLHATNQEGRWTKPRFVSKKLYAPLELSLDQRVQQQFLSRFLCHLTLSP